jgi:predicted nuclease of predicted toxin-antitoxin system
MRFLVDAQLPTALKEWINAGGHDCTHVIDLPRSDRTSDKEIVDVVAVEDRILISKDSDFLKMKLLRGRPDRLLLITTGNIRNPELLSLFEANFATALRLFETYEIVELSNSFVVGRNTDQS